VAAKIIRQSNKIVVLGAPTSAAALVPGHEKAPARLRAAGLVQRLTAAGYLVTDMGDDPVELFRPDEESPRARNARGVLRALETLRPRVELAIKSGALPLILAGDCSVALATTAALRRYHSHVSMIYVDRDADLNIPATSPSGCLDGMVISHLAGRGAAELVRFWGQPPLVREPDLVLFGVARMDPPEEEVLRRSPLQCYSAADIQRTGPANAAQSALDRVHGATSEFVLHFDVDVISSEDFRATNFPGTGGLHLEEVREALLVFARQPHLAALEVSAYNPDLDPSGAGAETIVELLVAVLRARLETLPSVEPAPKATVRVSPPAPQAIAAGPGEPGADGS
jgi:arginase